MSDDLNTTVAYADFIVELKKAKDRIEELEAALREIIDIHPFKDPEGDVSIKSLVDLVFGINITARKALDGKDD